MYASEENHNKKENPQKKETQSPVPWSTGLCGCFRDWDTCCLTFWCPCITFGRIAEMVERGTTSFRTSCTLYYFPGFARQFHHFHASRYRTRIRKQYLLDESPCHDSLVHLWCEGCGLCQEYNELKNRGFDMKIGWQGNVERKTRGVATLPPAADVGMSR